MLNDLDDIAKIKAFFECSDRSWNRVSQWVKVLFGLTHAAGDAGRIPWLDDINYSHHKWLGEYKAVLREFRVKRGLKYGFTS
jgi:hypothetical protein